MVYEVRITRLAENQFNKLPKNIQPQIRDAILSLEKKPRPEGFENVKGKSKFLRIRVGEYRVIYTVIDDKLIVLIVKMGHRKDVYRNIQKLNIYGSSPI